MRSDNATQNGSYEGSMWTADIHRHNPDT